MNTVENFRLEVYTAFENDKERQMVVIQANIPGNGLGYISFYLTRLEFIDLCTGGKYGGRSSFEDGYHMLRVFGDQFLFYDMDNWPRDSAGIMNINYANLTIPRMAQRVMLQRANRVWNAQRASKSDERVTIEFSKSVCEKLIRRFGCGKGKAKLEFRDGFSGRPSQEWFEHCLNRGGEHSLEKNIDKLLTIAKNGTQAYYEKTKVTLGKDGNGFYFDILSPKGSSTMCGGLINHGTFSEPDWSIHT